MIKKSCPLVIKQSALFNPTESSLQKNCSSVVLCKFFVRSVYRSLRLVGNTIHKRFHVQVLCNQVLILSSACSSRFLFQQLSLSQDSPDNLEVAMRNQDMNLIYVFNAIMTERSITRAGERLSLTQPAVSNMVSRMRHLWKDPVFVKHGRSIEPTAFAVNLWEQIKQPIAAISNAVNLEEFDPLTSKRQFKIAIRDVVADMAWVELSGRLSKIAPGVDLYAVPYTIQNAFDHLREASVDLAIGSLSSHDHSIRSTWLFDSDYVLAMRKDHPLADQPVTRQDFLAAKHLMVSFSGATGGFIDQALQREGDTRRVGLTVNHFGIVPSLLRNSDMIATLPRIATGGADYSDNLHLTSLPFQIDPTRIFLIWHARHDRDPGLIWLRHLVETVVKEQWTKCRQRLVQAGEPRHLKVASG